MNVGIEDGTEQGEDTGRVVEIDCRNKLAAT